MIAGHNDTEKVECKVYIYDADLYADFAHRDEAAGKNRYMLQTMLVDVDTEEQMMQFATGRTEKTKGGEKSGGGKNGGGRGSERSGSGHKGKGGRARGNGNASGAKGGWVGKISPSGGAAW